MGFLDNTSNTIIIDAVLTDLGRQLLAKNDGSFNIAKFALGDDEINYNIIEKYGAAVGTEKIEKNTPVFEAITNQSQAQKYKLVSISNPNLIRLPNLSFTIKNATNSTESASIVVLGKNNQRSATVTISQTLSNAETVDVELRDQVYSIEMSNLFLEPTRGTAESIDLNQRAVYKFGATGELTNGGTAIDFSFQSKSISDSLFQVYGNFSNKNIISTIVKVVGMQSGAVVEFKVNINKNI